MAEFGCWLDLPSPQVAEIMAQTGFDFIVIDLEHGPASIETAQMQMMAMKATGCRAIVRVPEASEAWVKRVLDAGAQGVMVPKVETAAQAAEIASWAYYAPKGVRGDAWRVVRASGWGRGSDAYKESWNADGFVAVQIESVLGLANIKEIAAVKGVTQLF
ncbi:MAG: HpcH/HpaI aldolase family protein, partial [Alphaproteobacteria bacterium]